MASFYTMYKAINETGNRYGRLVVIKQVENNKCRQAQWLCKCDCRKETSVAGVALRSGGTKSCGCLQLEAVSKCPGVRAFNLLYSGMKCKAKARGYKWKLSKEQVRQLTKQNCFYCGTKPAQVFFPTRCTNGAYTYNGLDRRNNNQGYTIDNVVPCCGYCNWAKKDTTIDEFYGWIARAHEHLALGEKQK